MTKTMAPATVSRASETPFIGLGQAAAEQAGLRYVNDDEPGIRRLRRGRAFRYVAANGDPVKDAATLARIRKLAIPPAYEDVWICASANGHLQASGRDAKGRKQYRYHEAFRAVRDGTKYGHLIEFASALPRIRATVEAHMALRGLPREKVLATVVRLLETTMIRVGNTRYAESNKSYGLSTLKTRHVAVEGSELRFRFTGKSGKQWRLNLRDRRVARIVRAMQELPGQHLFQYLDTEGSVREITSGDINAYLKEISQADLTAKDFRTWTGTVLAAVALNELGKPETLAAGARNIKAAVSAVSSILGNTATVCRKCYIHPAVIEGYVAGELRLRITAVDRAGGQADLTPEERAVLRFLRRQRRADPD
ncbi:MAG: DNA topoisomerase IB [Novosphingobium sp.]